MTHSSSVQSDLADHGTEPMFKLRVTHLGTESFVVAASWMHILADGKQDCCSSLVCMADVCC